MPPTPNQADPQLENSTTPLNPPENQPTLTSTPSPAPQDIPGNPATVPAIPAWQAMIYEERQRAQRAEAELERLRAQNTSPAPALPELKPGDLIENPNKLTDYIQQTMAQSTAPLNAFVQKFSRDQAYNNLKSRVRSQFPDFAKIEHFVDQAMEGQEPNERNLQIAIQQVVGYLTLNGAFNQPPQNQPPAPPAPTPVAPTPVIPPNIPPSRTPAPQNNKPKYDLADFTESERRLMRENNLTPAQWVALRDCPPEKVHLLDLSQIKD